MNTYTYEIVHDTDASDPSAWSEYLSFLICTTRGRYADDRNYTKIRHLCEGNTHRMKAEDSDAVEQDYLSVEEYVYLVKRYNLGIVEERSTQYQSWAAIIPYPTVKKEYGHTNRKTKENAQSCARAELAEFIAWLEGECYGWIVSSDEEDHIDSCWGYYGDDGYKMAEEDAISQIAWLEERDRKSHTSKEYAYA